MNHYGGQFILHTKVPWHFSDIARRKVSERSWGILILMSGHKVFQIPFADIYPLYVKKAERKGRTQEEVDHVITWLTGYSPDQMRSQIHAKVTLEEFFAQATQLNPKRELITGVVCGVRVENVEDPLMREIRYMDKLVDELARGKALNKILRT